jgi:hypothetical protein
MDKFINSREDSKEDCARGAVHRSMSFWLRLGSRRHYLFLRPPEGGHPHLFYGCPLAQSALGWVSSIIHQGIQTAPDITVRRALYGFTRQERVSPVCP